MTIKDLIPSLSFCHYPLDISLISFSGSLYRANSTPTLQQLQQQHQAAALLSPSSTGSSLLFGAGGLHGVGAARLGGSGGGGGSYAQPRVRNRTSFDPEEEIPRLQHWFAINQHPSRVKLEMYLQELNNLPIRYGEHCLKLQVLCAIHSMTWCLKGTISLCIVQSTRG